MYKDDLVFDGADDEDAPRPRRPKPKAPRYAKTPTRCVACGAAVFVPDSKNPDDALEEKMFQCLTSNDPICKKATKRKDIVVFIQRANNRMSKQSK